jgi:hypothetical protein
MMGFYNPQPNPLHKIKIQHISAVMKATKITCNNVAIREICNDVTTIVT